MLGTHNSMSYLSPKKWWMYLGRFIAQCLSKSVEEQYNKYGVRLFDIRISYDKNNIPEFRHGVVAFKGNVYQTLKYLNSLGDMIYIRLTLETSKEDCRQENLFIGDCQIWDKLFSNLIFFNGVRKFDWKKLYKFPIEDLPLTQIVGSMSGRKINGLYPKLYAKLHNRLNIEANKNKPYCLIDFIEIQ